MTIAIDFDGTIVEHRYQEIGEEYLFRNSATKVAKLLCLGKKRKVFLCFALDFS